MISSPSAAPTDDTRQVPHEPPRGIDLTHGTPPPEVLDQMAHADEINSRLRAEGREVRFAISSDGCSLQIELCDSHGKLLRTLSIAEAAALAEGELQE